MLDLKLTNKRALVTGSSSGIGAAIARALAGQGARVVVHGRDRERAERVCQSIRDTGGSAYVVLADLAHPQAARSVAGGALEALGGVDILVNNAGGLEEGLKQWPELEPRHWQATFEQNVFSAVRLVRELLPTMKAARWGRIVQISSAVATQPLAMGPDYAAAKAALGSTTATLAKHLTDTGITVNSVSPGPILTATAERVFGELAKERGWGEDWAQIERRAVESVMPNPLNRMGRVEEVADLVTFLASPLAGYIHGANFRIDGGYVSASN
jgi:3-oxoacyl-[acyl-carrier protein] reductase